MCKVRFDLLATVGLGSRLPVGAVAKRSLARYQRANRLDDATSGVLRTAAI